MGGGDEASLSRRARAWIMIAIMDEYNALGMRPGLRVQHAHSLEHRDERLVVLGENVKHAVRHRLLVVAAHLRHVAAHVGLRGACATAARAARLRHEPKIEQRHLAVLGGQQIPFVRVAVNEAARHQLHREAAHRRTRERLGAGDRHELGA